MNFNALIAVLLASFLVFGCCMAPSTEGAGQTGNNQASGGQAGGGNDLVGKSYEQLMALGVPMQCDITTESGTTRLYKGTGEDMRTEMATDEGACPKVVMIMKGDKYYVGCEGGELMPGSDCKWLEFTQQETSGGTAGAYEKPDYSNVPPAKITCQPWLLDPSKLQTPSGACNFEEMMKNLQTR